jgi:hypothetical protein
MVRRSVLEVDGLVVLVPEDVEGAHHHARGASRAQPRGHDLVIEVAPLRLVAVERHAVEYRARGDVPNRASGPAD